MVLFSKSEHMSRYPKEKQLPKYVALGAVRVLGISRGAGRVAAGAGALGRVPELTGSPVVRGRT